MSALLSDLPVDVATALAGARSTLTQAGVSEASLEASVLLGHLLDRPRAWLIAHGEAPLSPSVAACFLALVARRRRREPSAYLTGEKQWLNLILTVNRNALIPRPETELLAGRAISLLHSMVASTVRPPLAVDVGTGSGAIAIALARGAAGARVLAVDISESALRLARDNAIRFGAGSITFLHGGLLSPVREEPNLIVANLPYVPRGDLIGLEPELAYEPAGALDGGEDGLDLIRALFKQAKPLLATGSHLLLEFGAGQAPALTREVLSTWPAAEIEILRDYAGIERIADAQIR